ncbi:MAG: glycosyltransferase family 2 protein [Dehalococcoidia bacterium]
MTLPTVSVVIPAFNSERFVAEAIESARRQTVSPLEIIVVDDGSTDGTLEIARQLPVTVLALPHAGVSRARNEGTLSSTGEWIAFLDSDDIWHPEKLARQLEVALGPERPDIVMAQQSYLFEGPVPPWFRGPLDGTTEPGFQPSNWLLRRSAWERVGRFDESLTHSEDTDWLARASDLGLKIRAAEHPLVVHRIHDRNASGMPEAVRAGVLRALRESVHRKRERT